MKRKLLFFIPKLSAGGSEKVTLHLLNNFDRSKYDIYLGILSSRGEFFSELKPDIKIHNMDTTLSNSLFKMAGLINSIRPDIVMSNLCSMNLVVGFTRLFILNKKPMYVARESGIPSQRELVFTKMRIYRILYRLSYLLFDRVVCQSDDMLEEVHELYRVPLSKLIKIYNPININLVRQLSKENSLSLQSDKINLLAVGRLDIVKGYDQLLKSFALTKNERLHLHILGNGAEGPALKRFAADLRISERVTFHDFQKNPYSFMSAADLFVMTSKYEGLPNAMLEAMSLGCPAVAYQCKGGIKEIIHDGQNGYLIKYGDIDKFAEMLDRGIYLMLNRDQIAKQVLDRFNLQKIICDYEKVFSS